MEKKQLVRLAQKYLNGSATEQEIQLLNEWYDAAEEDEIESVFTQGAGESGDSIKNRGLSRLLRAIDQDAPQHEATETEEYDDKRIKWEKPIQWMAAASVILVIIAAATYFSARRSTGKQTARVETIKAHPNNDIPPVGNKARLMLEDGSSILLEETKDGLLKKEAGIEIHKDKGQLTYRASGETAGTATTSLHTLVTPRGSQYRLVLPDGSKVWLNTASSLQFPASFHGKERRVLLNGEAYFEITKNAAMPFRVTTASSPESPGGMQVEVLGTHFNIMSYADEGTVNTTLLEGSVKVSGGAASSLLKPGEQASLNKTAGRISISHADIEETIAWKNGLFRFDGATIETVMKQLARWYDVEVIYKGNVTKHFRGMISRSVSISQVLKMLELTSEVHFKIDGPTITVMP